MELVLNLVWAVLAVAGLVCWLRANRAPCADRSTQIIALAMLILILFPIISVTDDIWAAQNPAEADSSIRRDEFAGHPHSIAPHFAIVPRAEQVELSLTVPAHLPERDQRIAVHQAPPRSIPFTRPPPAA